MSNLLSQASLVMIPSGYKEDVVYSQIPTDGSGDLSFTRASNGTRINSAGLVEVCPWNFMQQSNAFSSSPWLKSSTTLTSGQSDPNGGTSAWKVEFAGGGNAYLGQFGIGQIGVVTISAYFRADSTTTIGFNDGSAFANSITIGTTWQRYEFSYTVTGGQCNMQIDNYFGVSPSAQAKTFYIYGAQLNIGSTAKPYFPTTDRLNVPRLTYQNGGGGCPSLLLEKQSTNNVLYSEDFSQADWVKASAGTGSVPVVTTNYATSPDGTQNADLVVFDRGAGNTSSDFSWLYQTFVTASATYTMSCYVKAATSADVGKNLSWRNFGTGNAWSVTLTNEWQRISVQENSAGGVAEVGFYNRGGYSTGNSVSVLMWGFQAEQSSYATSLIPTTSASATRVADACYKTGISSLIGQSEGVMFIDCVLNGTSTGGASNYGNIINTNRTANTTAAIAFLYFESTSTLTVNYFNGNGSYTPIVTLDKASINMGDRVKIAFAYKSGDFALYVNGSLAATSTTTFTPAGGMTDIYIDDVNIYYGYPMGLKINEVVLIKTRVSNAELASLTTI